MYPNTLDSHFSPANAVAGPSRAKATRTPARPASFFAPRISVKSRASTSLQPSGKAAEPIIISDSDNESTGAVASSRTQGVGKGKGKERGNRINRPYNIDSDSTRPPSETLTSLIGLKRNSLSSSPLKAPLASTFGTDSFETTDHILSGTGGKPADQQDTSMEYVAVHGEAGPSRPRSSIPRQNTSRPKVSKLEARRRRSGAESSSVSVKAKPPKLDGPGGTKEDPIDLASLPGPDPKPAQAKRVTLSGRSDPSTVLSTPRTPSSSIPTRPPSTQRPGPRASRPSTPIGGSHARVGSTSNALFTASLFEPGSSSTTERRQLASMESIPSNTHAGPDSPDDRASIGRSCSPMKRGAGGFGSHAKRFDPNRAVIGRTLSREIAEGLVESPLRRNPTESILKAGTPRRLPSPHNSSVVPPPSVTRSLFEGAPLNPAHNTPQRITPRKNTSAFVLAKNNQHPTTSPLKTQLQPSKGTDNRSATAHRSHIDPDDTVGRPKRARPDVGAYVIPPMDAREWPNAPGSESQLKRRKKIRDDGDTLRQPGSRVPARLGRSAGLSVSSTKNLQSSPLTSLDSISATVSPAKRRIGTEQELGHEKSVSDTDEDDAEEADVDTFVANWDHFQFDAPDPAIAQPIEVSAAPGTSNEKQADGTATPPRRDVPAQISIASASPTSPIMRQTSTENVSIELTASAKKKTILQKTEELKAAREEMKRKAREDAVREQQERFEHLENMQLESESEESEDDWGKLFAASGSPPIGNDRPDEIPRRTGRHALGHSPHKAKVHPIPQTTTPKASPFAKVHRDIARREKTGLTSAQAHAVLAEIRRKCAAVDTHLGLNHDGDDNDGHNSYPTPKSVVDEPEDTTADPEQMKEALKDEAMPSGLIDDELFEEVMEEEQDAEKPWAGFWDESWVQPEENGIAAKLPPTLLSRKRDIYGKLLAEAVRMNKLRSVAILLSRGDRCASLLRRRTNVESLSIWLLQKAMETNAGERHLATQCLQKILAMDVPHALGKSADLLSILVSLFKQHGFDEIFCSAEVKYHPLVSGVRLARDEACELICALARSAAKHNKLSPTDSKTLAYILLALATDDTTLPVMLALLEDTLPSLWEHAAIEHDPLRLAHDLLTLLEDTDLSLQACSIMLVRIGCRTETQRAIARWLAIGLLSPQSLNEASVGGFSVPFSLSLCDGAVAIVNEVQQENPNHAHISAQLVFISEALTDINTMFSESGKNLEGDINELENLLRRADGKIVVKAYSKDDAHINKTRLSQLYVNIKQMLVLERNRRTFAVEKRKREKMKGMEAGVGGQMRLSFAAKSQITPTTPVTP